jgi:hypothetical protein
MKTISTTSIFKDKKYLVANIKKLEEERLQYEHETYAHNCIGSELYKLYSQLELIDKETKK